MDCTHSLRVRAEHRAHGATGSRQHITSVAHRALGKQTAARGGTVVGLHSLPEGPSRASRARCHRVTATHHVSCAQCSSNADCYSGTADALHCCPRTSWRRCSRRRLHWRRSRHPAHAQHGSRIIISNGRACTVVGLHSLTKRPGRVSRARCRRVTAIHHVSCAQGTRQAHCSERWYGCWTALTY